MPSQQSKKSDIVPGRDVEDEGFELHSKGDNAGTDTDMQDMRMLGRTQQLSVSMIDPGCWIKELMWNSVIFASSRPSVSPVL